MKLLLPALFILLSSFISHDVQVANFKIHQKSDLLVVDFELEKEDILNILETNKSELTTEKLVNYINTHFFLKINGQETKLSFYEAKVKAKHIKIRGTSAYPKNKIESLELDNTLLLSIPDHSNIIEIRLNDQERDFLMNHKRTQIKVSL